MQGPRRCVGVYDPSKSARRPCLYNREPESGSQCRACAFADPGRLVAQDRVGPDGTLPAGAFRVYLALFGRDAVKVGLTAQRRAADRLLEQGAFAHVFLCEGAYPAIRQVERLVSSRLALPERLTWRRKRGLWHEATDPGHRAAVLTTRAKQARPLLTGCPVSILADAAVVDDLPEYGVAPHTLPNTLRVATSVHSGAPPDDDAAHQHNWERKEQLLAPCVPACPCAGAPCNVPSDTEESCGRRSESGPCTAGSPTCAHFVTARMRRNAAPEDLGRPVGGLHRSAQRGLHAERWGRSRLLPAPNVDQSNPLPREVMDEGASARAAGVRDRPVA
ncbi:MAG: DUF2797 domain-containing protein [Egibacteraceae bacterium]